MVFAIRVDRDRLGGGFLLALLFSLFLLACSDDDKQPPTQPGPTLEARIQTMLNEAVATDSIPGAMITVYQPGSIDWSGASGLAILDPPSPMQPEQSFRVGSITKMMAAVIALELAEENVLGLDHPIDDYLRESLVDSLPRGREITVRMLLNHTSGLADYTDNPDLEAALLADPNRHWRSEELIGLALQLAPPGEPGGAWHYASTNFILLQMILEARTGTSFAELLRTRIALPLGLGRTLLPATSALDGAHGYQDLGGDGQLDDLTFFDPSYVGAAGGAVSNTRELVSFSRAVFDGRLLSLDSREAMMTTIPTNQPIARYGLGLTLLLGSYYGHAGELPGYTSGLFYMPTRQLTVAVMLNQGGTELAALTLFQRVVSLFITTNDEGRPSTVLTPQAWRLRSKPRGLP